MAAVNAPAGIGALWQQRLEKLQEYEVIRDGNIFRTSFQNSYVFASEYEQARQYLDWLIAKYRNVPFTTIFSGNELANEGGVCFSLCSYHPTIGKTIDIERFRSEILKDLTLVLGIGEKIERRLKNRGYQTLFDLLQHQKFRMPARQVIECLTYGNSIDIINLIGRRHSRSHPRVLGTAGFHDPEEYVFLDIETLGLFSRPIILFGVGTIENRRLVVHQYLLRDIDEEQAALIATIEQMSGEHPALITFNGKSFDFPYLQDRLAYYGMNRNSQIPHFDVLQFSRNRWRDEFHSLRLCILEKEILGINRENDIPGQMVPEFYETYLHTNNCGPLIPIIEHNKQDVVSLALLFFRLLNDYYGCC